MASGCRYWSLPRRDRSGWTQGSFSDGHTRRSGLAGTSSWWHLGGGYEAGLAFSQSRAWRTETRSQERVRPRAGWDLGSAAGPDAGLGRQLDGRSAGMGEARGCGMTQWRACLPGLRLSPCLLSLVPCHLGTHLHPCHPSISAPLHPQHLAYSKRVRVC